MVTDYTSLPSHRAETTWEKCVWSVSSFTGKDVVSTEVVTREFIKCDNFYGCAVTLLSEIVKTSSWAVETHRTWFLIFTSWRAEYNYKSMIPYSLCYACMFNMVKCINVVMTEQHMGHFMTLLSVYYQCNAWYICYYDAIWIHLTLFVFRSCFPEI